MGLRFVALGGLYAREMSAPCECIQPGLSKVSRRPPHDARHRGLRLPAAFHHQVLPHVDVRLHEDPVGRGLRGPALAQQARGLESLGQLQVAAAQLLHAAVPCAARVGVAGGRGGQQRACDRQHHRDVLEPGAQIRLERVGRRHALAQRSQPGRHLRRVVEVVHHRQQQTRAAAEHQIERLPRQAGLGRDVHQRDRGVAALGDHRPRHLQHTFARAGLGRGRCDGLAAGSRLHMGYFTRVNPRATLRVSSLRV